MPPLLLRALPARIWPMVCAVSSPPAIWTVMAVVLAVASILLVVWARHVERESRRGRGSAGTRRGRR